MRRRHDGDAVESDLWFLPLGQHLAIENDTGDGLTRKRVSDLSRQLRRQFAPPAEGKIEPRIAFHDMDLGFLARREKRPETVSQDVRKVQQSRSQNQAFAHVHNGVAFGGVKTGDSLALLLAEFENGAAA